MKILLRGSDFRFDGTNEGHQICPTVFWGRKNDNLKKIVQRDGVEKPPDIHFTKLTNKEILYEVKK